MKNIWKKRVKLALSAALVALILVAGGCGDTTHTSADKKLEVVTTVYPAYDIAKQVGGDKVNVAMLVPVGSEPHDWEPKVSDLEKIGKAKVFIYNGAGLEPTDKLLTKEVLKDAKPLELAKSVELLKRNHDKEGEEHEHQNEYDPHIWLDPSNVIKEVAAVTKAFQEADPANKDYYEKNGKAYVEKLTTLDNNFKAFTSTLQQKELVVSHKAFGYLAHRYGLNELGIMGVNSEAEPTPEQLAKIVEFAKANHVKVVFSEELVSPKLAEVIAKEAGAKVKVLNPIEGLSEEQIKNGVTYLSLMEENLKVLKENLK